jgi:hypothetical protein
VGDVGAVEALALLNQRLRPDHLLDWAESYWHVEDRVSRRVREPLFVHTGDAVT